MADRIRAHWADPGRPGYRVQQKPVGRGRKQEDRLPTNDDFPQTWMPIKSGRVLCAADVLPFDPSKRRVKKQPQEFHIEDYPVEYPEDQLDIGEGENTHETLMMGVDYALKDLSAARDAAYASGEETLGARINQAIEQAYTIIMGRGV